MGRAFSCPLLTVPSRYCKAELWSILRSECDSTLLHAIIPTCHYLRSCYKRSGLITFTFQQHKTVISSDRGETCWFSHTVTYLLLQCTDSLDGKLSFDESRHAAIFLKTKSFRPQYFRFWNMTFFPSICTSYTGNLNYYEFYMFYVYQRVTDGRKICHHEVV